MSQLSYLGPHHGPCNTVAQRPTFRPEDKRDKENFCLGTLATDTPFHTQTPGSIELQEQAAGRKEAEEPGRRAFVRRLGPRGVRCPVIPTGG